MGHETKFGKWTVHDKNPPFKNSSFHTSFFCYENYLGISSRQLLAYISVFRSVTTPQGNELLDTLLCYLHYAPNMLTHVQGEISYTQGYQVMRI